MNLRRLNLPLILALHLALIYIGGYFLSPEFSIYPFLTSHGFLPYKEILDQHFPSILFGPFSLPALFTRSAGSTLLFFLGATFATDVLLYVYLVKKGIGHSISWLFLWVLVSFWFGGNTLWLETIVVLLFSISLLFSLSKNKFSALLQGFVISLGLMARPLLFPAGLYLLFKNGKSHIFYKIAGSILPAIITLYFLIKNNLWSDFFHLTYIFNRNYYVQLASKPPSFNQVLQVSLVVVFLSLLLIRKRRFLSLFIALLAFTLAFPRFEMLHLQVGLFLLILGVAESRTHYLRVIYLLTLVLLAFSVIKVSRHQYGNFYYNPNVLQISRYLQETGGSTVYLLGASDLIYPLSGRIPPGYIYLPSLPWYFHDKFLLAKELSALILSPGTPIVVDINATIDGVGILKESGSIGKFIIDNYQITATVSGYHIYTRL